MSTITSIEPQIKDKTRCSIFLDGKFYCGIKLESAVKFRLKVGMQIERTELDQIQLDTEKLEATEKALVHISVSPKTEKQMRTFLEGKGYVPSVVEYVIERMAYYGYVDDLEYCNAYIRGVSGKSKRAIQADLVKRGADRSAIEEALKNYSDDGDEILTLLKKYLRGKERTKENVYKAYRYIVSKGYDYDLVKSACERLDEDEED